MIRLLQLLILVALAVLVWRVARRMLDRGRGPYPPSPEPPRFEATERCARCGTHVPRTSLDGAGVCARCRDAA